MIERKSTVDLAREQYNINIHNIHTETRSKYIQQHCIELLALFSPQVFNEKALSQLYTHTHTIRIFSNRNNYLI